MTGNDPVVLRGLSTGCRSRERTLADICHHVIAARSLRAPDTFADAFRVVGEAALIARDQVYDLADMAGFRNLLVRGYAHVDDRIVLTILRSRLNDLDRFSQSAATF